MSDEKKKTEKKELSLADEILAMDDLPQEEVTVPEWGGRTFLVVGMNGKERYNLVNQSADDNGLIDAETMSKLSIVKCLCDPETRERIFTDDQADAVMQKNAKVIEELLVVVNRINGFGDDAMEQAEKNS